jgi:hypothetical protein
MGQRERTEAGRLACTYPGSMLPLVIRGSARKLRLFCCACVRRNWDLLTDEHSRKAVEAAERWADGLATAKELAAAFQAAHAAEQPYDGSRQSYVKRAAALAARPRKDLVCATVWYCRSSLGRDQMKAEERHQCDLLRDLFGVPFRPVAFDPAWQGGAAARVALAIYDENRFSDLPILADALEDAGCTNAEVLAHCRGGGVHVRGCWVVDRLTGKE